MDIRNVLFAMFAKVYWNHLYRIVGDGQQEGFNYQYIFRAPLPERFPREAFIKLKNSTCAVVRNEILPRVTEKKATWAEMANEGQICLLLGPIFQSLKLH